MSDTIPAPVLTLAEANALLTAPGGRFEMGEEVIGGQRLRVFTGAHASLRALFDASARFGTREYLVHEDERVTYDAFRRAAIRLARRLQAEGVVPGDRVAIVMRNMPEWFVAFYAAVLTGAIVTPLNGWWIGPELEYGLANSGAKLAIVDPERLAVLLPHLDACPELVRMLVARAGSLPGDARLSRLEDAIGCPADWASLPLDEVPAIAFHPDDAVAIFYTSGTTGKPKGAVASHRNILSNIPAVALGGIRAMIRWGAPLPPVVDPLTLPQRVNLLAVPLFHATGMVTQLVIALNAGTKVVMMRRWHAAEAAKLIETERVTATGGVPTIAWQLLEQAERGEADLTSLSAIAYGGAPAAAELTRRLKAQFPALQMATGWGMTETMATMTSAMMQEYETHPSSAGSPSPVNDLQIRDPDDGKTVLPIGTVGELWARGPQVVKGYWNRPEANAETFVAGWLRTGDLARLDEEGFLYIVDRAKDMVIRGGENIYCLEVENAIYEHPDVMDAAVVGIPHQVLGEEPAAVVRVRAESAVSEADLIAHVAARIARFKVPVKVLFLGADLPRNPNGKILKSELRTMFAATEG